MRKGGRGQPPEQENQSFGTGFLLLDPHVLLFESLAE